MNAEGTGDLADVFAFLEQSFGELALIFIHLLGATEADAALVRVRPSGPVRSRIRSRSDRRYQQRWS